MDYTVRIGRGLGVKGLMNIQFVIVEGAVSVLEVNPRASRTAPFIAKVTDVPVIRLATQAMLGRSLRELGYQTGLYPSQNLVSVKAPVFAMAKLVGVDTYLGPEMKSTGEVMGIDHDYRNALTKALIASGMLPPSSGGILLSIADPDKPESRPMIRRLIKLGYKLYAT